MTEQVEAILKGLGILGAFSMTGSPEMVVSQVGRLSIQASQDLLDHLLSLPELQETREHSHPTRNYCDHCWAQDIRNKAIRDVRSSLKRELGMEADGK